MRVFGKDETFQKFIKERIKKYNNQVSISHKEVRKPENIEYINFVLDDPHFKGGLTGSVYWDQMELHDLFIDEDYRHRGVGTELLQAAIEEAYKRNLKFIHLKSFSFQTNDYYPKFGFKVVGELKDHPPGETLYWFRLDLKQKEEA